MQGRRSDYTVWLEEPRCFASLQEGKAWVTQLRAETRRDSQEASVASNDAPSPQEPARGTKRTRNANQVTQRAFPPCRHTSGRCSPATTRLDVQARESVGGSNERGAAQPEGCDEGADSDASRPPCPTQRRRLDSLATAGRVATGARDDLAPFLLAPAEGADSSALSHLPVASGRGSHGGPALAAGRQAVIAEDDSCGRWASSAHASPAQLRAQALAAAASAGGPQTPPPRA